MTAVLRYLLAAVAGLTVAPVVAAVLLAAGIPLAWPCAGVAFAAVTAGGVLYSRERPREDM